MEYDTFCKKSEKQNGSCQYLGHCHIDNVITSSYII